MKSVSIENNLSRQQWLKRSIWYTFLFAVTFSRTLPIYPFNLSHKLTHHNHLASLFFTQGNFKYSHTIPDGFSFALPAHLHRKLIVQDTIKSRYCIEINQNNCFRSLKSIFSKLLQIVHVFSNWKWKKVFFPRKRWDSSDSQGNVYFVSFHLKCFSWLNSLEIINIKKCIKHYLLQLTATFRFVLLVTDAQLLLSFYSINVNCTW